MPDSPIHVVRSKPASDFRQVPTVSLVFTHGYGGSANTWDAQVNHFQSSHELATWDLLGHGQSAKPTTPSSYSRTRALADLDEVIANTTPPYVLIGHSLGGYLAQCRYLNDPTAIAGLVLIATGPGFRSDSGRNQWNTNVQQAAVRFNVPHESAGMVEQHDTFVMDNLEKLDCPLLQIAGSRDKGFLPAMEILQARVPDVTTLIVPDAGHQVHETHAVEVNQAIQTFLDRLGAGDADRTE